MFERVGYEGLRKGSGRRPALSCGHTIILVKKQTGKSKNYASSDTKANIREKTHRSGFGYSLSDFQEHLLNDREAAHTYTIFAYHFGNNNQ